MHETLDIRSRGPRRDSRSERGYAMAGLLVAIGIMSILMSVAMPPWRTYAKREKEAELLFRGSSTCGRWSCISGASPARTRPILKRSWRSASSAARTGTR